MKAKKKNGNRGKIWFARRAFALALFIDGATTGTAALTVRVERPGTQSLGLAICQVELLENGNTIPGVTAVQSSTKNDDEALFGPTNALQPALQVCAETQDETNAFWEATFPTSQEVLLSSLSLKIVASTQGLGGTNVVLNGTTLFIPESARDQVVQVEYDTETWRFVREKLLPDWHIPLATSQIRICAKSGTNQHAGSWQTVTARLDTSDVPVVLGSFGLNEERCAIIPDFEYKLFSSGTRPSAEQLFTRVFISKPGNDGLQLVSVRVDAKFPGDTMFSTLVQWVSTDFPSNCDWGCSGLGGKWLLMSERSECNTPAAVVELRADVTSGDCNGFRFWPAMPLGSQDYAMRICAKSGTNQHAGSRQVVTTRLDTSNVPVTLGSFGIDEEKCADVQDLDKVIYFANSLVPGNLFSKVFISKPGNDGLQLVSVRVDAKLPGDTEFSTLVQWVSADFPSNCDWGCSGLGGKWLLMSERSECNTPAAVVELRSDVTSGGCNGFTFLASIPSPTLQWTLQASLENPSNQGVILHADIGSLASIGDDIPKTTLPLVPAGYVVQLRGPGEVAFAGSTQIDGTLMIKDGLLDLNDYVLFGQGRLILDNATIVGGEPCAAPFFSLGNDRCGAFSQDWVSSSFALEACQELHPNATPAEDHVELAHFTSVSANEIVRLHHGSCARGDGSVEATCDSAEALRVACVLDIRGVQLDEVLSVGSNAILETLDSFFELESLLATGQMLEMQLPQLDLLDDEGDAVSFSVPFAEVATVQIRVLSVNGGSTQAAIDTSPTPSVPSSTGVHTFGPSSISKLPSKLHIHALAATCIEEIELLINNEIVAQFPVSLFSMCAGNNVCVGDDMSLCSGAVVAYDAESSCLRLVPAGSSETLPSDLSIDLMGSKCSRLSTWRHPELGEPFMLEVLTLGAVSVVSQEGLHMSFSPTVTSQPLDMPLSKLSTRFVLKRSSSTVSEVTSLRITRYNKELAAVSFTDLSDCDMLCSPFASSSSGLKFGSQAAFLQNATVSTTDHDCDKIVSAFTMNGNPSEELCTIRVDSLPPGETLDSFLATQFALDTVRRVEIVTNDTETASDLTYEDINLPARRVVTIRGEGEQTRLLYRDTDLSSVGDGINIYGRLYLENVFLDSSVRLRENGHLDMSNSEIDSIFLKSPSVFSISNSRVGKLLFWFWGLPEVAGPYTLDNVLLDDIATPSFFETHGKRILNISILDKLYTAAPENSVECTATQPYDMSPDGFDGCKKRCDNDVRCSGVVLRMSEEASCGLCDAASGCSFGCDVLGGQIFLSAKSKLEYYSIAATCSNQLFTTRTLGSLAYPVSTRDECIAYCTILSDCIASAFTSKCEFFTGVERTPQEDFHGVTNLAACEESNDVFQLDIPFSNQSSSLSDYVLLSGNWAAQDAQVEVLQFFDEDTIAKICANVCKMTIACDFFVVAGTQCKLVSGTLALPQDPDSVQPAPVTFLPRLAFPVKSLVDLGCMDSCSIAEEREGLTFKDCYASCNVDPTCTAVAFAGVGAHSLCSNMDTQTFQDSFAANASCSVATDPGFQLPFASWDILPAQVSGTFQPIMVLDNIDSKTSCKSICFSMTSELCEAMQYNSTTATCSIGSVVNTDETQYNSTSVLRLKRVVDITSQYASASSCAMESVIAAPCTPKLFGEPEDQLLQCQKWCDLHPQCFAFTLLGGSCRILSDIALYPGCDSGSGPERLYHISLSSSYRDRFVRVGPNACLVRFNSSALESETSSTLAECMRKCAYSSACSAFVFNSQTETCTRSRTEDFESCDSDETLYVENREHFFSSPKGALWGSDVLLETTTVSLRACQIICDVTEGCSVIEYKQLSADSFQCKILGGDLVDPVEGTSYKVAQDIGLYTAGFAPPTSPSDRLSVHSGLFDLDECKALCEAHTSCGSFTFEKPECVLYKISAFADDTSTTSTPTYYVDYKALASPLREFQPAPSLCFAPESPVLEHLAQVLSLWECGQLCQRNYRCKAFTWKGDARQECTLYDDGFSLLSSSCQDNAPVAYVMFSRAQFSLKKGTCLENEVPVHSFSRKTSFECAALCDAWFNCRAFRHSSSNRDCLLFEDQQTAASCPSPSPNGELYLYYSEKQFTHMDETFCSASNPEPSMVVPFTPLEACKVLCDAHKDCLAFEHDREGTCSLFRTKDFSANCQSTSSRDLYITYREYVDPNRPMFTYAKTPQCFNTEQLESVPPSSTCCRRLCSESQTCFGYQESIDNCHIFTGTTLPPLEACDSNRGEEAFLRLRTNPYRKLHNSCPRNRLFTDSTRIRDKDFAECMMLCDAHPYCRYFVYGDKDAPSTDVAHRECVLFKGQAEELVDCSDCTEKFCKVSTLVNGRTFLDQTTWFGEPETTFATFQGVTYQECAALCDSIEVCDAFIHSWNYRRFIETEKQQLFTKSRLMRSNDFPTTTAFLSYDSASSSVYLAIDENDDDIHNQRIIFEEVIGSPGQVRLKFWGTQDKCITFERSTYVINELERYRRIDKSKIVRDPYCQTGKRSRIWCCNQACSQCGGPGCGGAGPVCCMGVMQYIPCDKNLASCMVQDTHAASLSFVHDLLFSIFIRRFSVSPCMDSSTFILRSSGDGTIQLEVANQLTETVLDFPGLAERQLDTIIGRLSSIFGETFQGDAKPRDTFKKARDLINTDTWQRFKDIGGGFSEAAAVLDGELIHHGGLPDFPKAKWYTVSEKVNVHNRKTKLCLGFSGSKTTLVDCNVYQEAGFGWTFVFGPNLLFVETSSGIHCLNAESLDLETCDVNAQRQKWEYSADDETIRSVGTGLCLLVPESASDPALGDCGTNPTEKWSPFAECKLNTREHTKPIKLESLGTRGQCISFDGDLAKLQGCSDASTTSWRYFYKGNEARLESESNVGCLGRFVEPYADVDKNTVAGKTTCLQNIHAWWKLSGSENNMFLVDLYGGLGDRCLYSSGTIVSCNEFSSNQTWRSFEDGTDAVEIAVKPSAAMQEITDPQLLFQIWLYSPDGRLSRLLLSLTTRFLSLVESLPELANQVANQAEELATIVTSVTEPVSALGESLEFGRIFFKAAEVVLRGVERIPYVGPVVKSVQLRPAVKIIAKLLKRGNKLCDAVGDKVGSIAEPLEEVYQVIQNVLGKLRDVVEMLPNFVEGLVDEAYCAFSDGNLAFFDKSQDIMRNIKDALSGVVARLDDIPNLFHRISLPAFSRNFRRFVLEPIDFANGLLDPISDLKRKLRFLDFIFDWKLCLPMPRIRWKKSCIRIKIGFIKKRICIPFPKLSFRNRCLALPEVADLVRMIMLLASGGPVAMFGQIVVEYAMDVLSELVIQKFLVKTLKLPELGPKIDFADTFLQDLKEGIEDMFKLVDSLDELVEQKVLSQLNGGFELKEILGGVVDSVCDDLTCLAQQLLPGISIPEIPSLSDIINLNEAFEVLLNAVSTTNGLEALLRDVGNFTENLECRETTNIQIQNPLFGDDSCNLIDLDICASFKLKSPQTKLGGVLDIVNGYLNEVKQAVNSILSRRRLAQGDGFRGVTILFSTSLSEILQGFRRFVLHSKKYLGVDRTRILFRPVEAIIMILIPRGEFVLSFLRQSLSMFLDDTWCEELPDSWKTYIRYANLFGKRLSLSWQKPWFVSPGTDLPDISVTISYAITKEENSLSFSLGGGLSLAVGAQKSVLVSDPSELTFFHQSLEDYRRVLSHFQDVITYHVSQVSHPATKRFAFEKTVDLGNKLATCMKDTKEVKQYEKSIECVREIEPNFVSFLTALADEEKRTNSKILRLGQYKDGTWELYDPFANLTIADLFRRELLEKGKFFRKPEDSSPEGRKDRSRTEKAFENVAKRLDEIDAGKEPLWVQELSKCSIYALKEPTTNGDWIEWALERFSWSLEYDKNAQEVHSLSALDGKFSFASWWGLTFELNGVGLLSLTFANASLSVSILPAQPGTVFKAGRYLCPETREYCNPKKPEEWEPRVIRSGMVKVSTGFSLAPFDSVEVGRRRVLHSENECQDVLAGEIIIQDAVEVCVLTTGEFLGVAKVLLNLVDGTSAGGTLSNAIFPPEISDGGWSCANVTGATVANVLSIDLVSYEESSISVSEVVVRNATVEEEQGFDFQIDATNQHCHDSFTLGSDDLPTLRLYRGNFAHPCAMFGMTTIVLKWPDPQEAKSVSFCELELFDGYGQKLEMRLAEASNLQSGTAAAGVDGSEDTCLRTLSEPGSFWTAQVYALAEQVKDLRIVGSLESAGLQVTLNGTLFATVGISTAPPTPTTFTTSSAGGGENRKEFSTTAPDATCQFGILDSAGSACCSWTCGACVEARCAERPGGKFGCCPSVIAASSPCCSEAKSPCALSSC